MAQLQTQRVTQAGLAPALQAASAGGDTYEPSSTTFLLVKNGDTAQHTVTIHTTATAFGQPISNVAVPVPAAGEMLLGPYEPGMIAQRADGLGYITYDAVTGVTVAALAI